MTTYTNTQRPKRLREGDEVVFNLRRDSYHYEVFPNFLFHLTTSNDIIFERLRLDKNAFAEEAYGYKSEGPITEWPESKGRDFAALCRLVNALYDEIDRQEKKKGEKEEEKPSPEKPAKDTALSEGSLTSLGWVWSQGKPGEANALEDCETPFNTREMALAEARESQLSPVYVFELFVGPAKKYTNQLVEETF